MNENTFTKPTESEIEILQVLWQKKQATVREIHNVLALTKAVGYTTTLKLMQLMLAKGLVARDPTTRTHIYTPALQQQHAQQHYLQKMITNLFSGSSTELVLQVLGNHKTNMAEISKIEEFLNTIKTKTV